MRRGRCAATLSGHALHHAPRERVVEVERVEQRRQTYTYHDYHGDEFGLYFGAGRVDPRRANDDLIALFARTLARP